MFFKSGSSDIVSKKSDNPLNLKLSSIVNARLVPYCIGLKQLTRTRNSRRTYIPTRASFQGGGLVNHQNRNLLLIALLLVVDCGLHYEPPFLPIYSLL